MKILQVNKLYYPHIGGIETVVQNIAEGLNDRTDMEVLVCQPKGKAISEVVNDVFVSRSGSMGTLFSMPISLSFISDFKKKAKKSDIVHIHMPFPLADLACIMSEYKGKVVVSWHSDVVKQKKLMLFYKPIMKRFLRRADKIIVATKGHIDGSEYLKPYRSKCEVIPYGLDIEDYEDIEDFRPILSDLLVSKQNKKVLFTGRLVYYKGVEVLINAFEKVIGCELFIVGRGSLETELQSRVEELGLSDKVHFMGNLSFEELKYAFADCDIFVLPSVANSEAFGIVQMEAMVYGKPVINTSLPTGVPHVSLDGQTGITVPPNDVLALAGAIQKLADDDDLRGKFGQNAYIRTREKFSMQKMLDDIYKLYEGLLGKNKRS
ncbi:MAG: glycosyltransferase [Clostridiales bacterium]|nr:glycosyltransferase [Clostridiales bacterium]